MLETLTGLENDCNNTIQCNTVTPIADYSLLVIGVGFLDSALFIIDWLIGYARRAWLYDHNVKRLLCKHLTPISAAI